MDPAQDEAGSDRRRHVFVVVAIVGMAAVPVWGRSPDPYITTHLALTYELGLIPRGLWGSVLDVLSLMPGSVTGAALAGHAVLVASVAGFVAVGLRGRTEWATSQRAVLACGVLASPAGFPFLAAEMGRLDVVLVVLTILAVGVGVRGRRFAPVGAGVIAAAAVLVHEAAALVTVPLVVVTVSRRHSARRALLSAGIALGALGAVVLLPMPVPQPDLAAWLATRIDRVDPFATMLPYQGLDTAWTRAWTHLTGPGVSQLGWTVLAVAAPVGLAARAIRRSTTLHRALFVLAALCPLLLVLVGTDIPRWFALSTLCLAGAGFAIVPAEARAHAVDGGLVAGCLVATVLLGPLSV